MGDFWKGILGLSGVEGLKVNASFAVRCIHRAFYGSSQIYSYVYCEQLARSRAPEIEFGKFFPIGIYSGNRTM